jgi:hypothetical protein
MRAVYLSEKAFGVSLLLRVILVFGSPIVTCVFVELDNALGVFVSFSIFVVSVLLNLVPEFASEDNAVVRHLCNIEKLPYDEAVKVNSLMEKRLSE